MNRPRFWGGRELPELFLGLLVLAVATVITGIVVADAVREVKKRRDTITVTGSARVPISADLASWRFSVQAQHADRLAANVSGLLEQGVRVSVGPISYVSTRLTEARLEALEAATANARDRADTIVEGLDGDLGPVRSAQLGVYQIVPQSSTEIADYGINDTTTREKDVISVVTVTFAVS